MLLVYNILEATVVVGFIYYVSKFHDILPSVHDNCKQATGLICTKQFKPLYCCLPQSCTVYGHPLEQKVTYFNQSSETQEQLMDEGELKLREEKMVYKGFFVPNHEAVFRELFEASVVRPVPRRLLASSLTFLCSFFPPFLLSLGPTNCPWVSEHAFSQLTKLLYSLSLNRMRVPSSHSAIETW